MDNYAKLVTRCLLACFVCFIVTACGSSAPAQSPTQASAVAAGSEATVEPAATAEPASMEPATAAPSPIPQSEAATATTAETVQIQQEDLDEVQALLSKLEQSSNPTFSGAVLIAQDDKILLSAGYGLADAQQELPNAPQTRYRIASITKQFTALAILMLQDQGKLTVNDFICTYIPDCPESWQPITIHHLLTHTAGLYDFRTFARGTQSAGAPSTSAQVIERIKEQPLNSAPGTQFGYSNGNFMVAGYVVEQVSQQPYAEFLQEQIFKPLGMDDTGYVGDNSNLAIGYDRGDNPAIQLDSSLPYAAGGLYSTVEDLYRYIQALRSGRLLSQPGLDAFFGLHERVDAAGGFSAGFQTPVHYGYGWALANYDGHPVIGHDGWIEGYSADLRLFPEDNITMILLMNRTDPYAPSVGDQLLPILFDR